MAMIYCNECGKEISDKADKCPHCGCPVSAQNIGNQNNSSAPVVVSNAIPEKKGSCLKTILIVFGVLVVIGIIGSLAGGKETEKESGTGETERAEEKVLDEGAEESPEIEDAEVVEKQDDAAKEEIEKYHVGDTWENKTLRMTYTDSYEFTEYNQYNAPADGNKIICAEFEFENMGNSDASVMYTDFHGYADGYEVNQSYAPDGTGLDFTVKMSAGRKGTGKVAFEIPEDAKEVEIEFSPNMFSSDKVIFVFR